MGQIPNDDYGAFCRHTHVAMKGSGKGPLAGLTFGVKDLYDIAGHKTGFGSPTWLATHEPAKGTSSLVARLLAAGADMVGKTQCDDLCYSLNGENVHYGTPVNPKAPDRIPGGSSSGSAVAVAAGLVDFALGSDTGGSVRLPASHCGIYGMRPTHGVLSLDNACPLVDSFDTAGWFAREPVLFERVGKVLLGDDRPAKPPIKALVHEDGFDLLGAAERAALAPAVRRIKAAVAASEEIRLGRGRMKGWMQAFRHIQGRELWKTHGDWISRHKPPFGPGIKERIAWASTLTDNDVRPHVPVRAEFIVEMEERLAGGTILVLPTMPGPAPLKGLAPEVLEDYRNRALTNLCLSGLAGLPQINLPFATCEGSPLGVSIVGARGTDRSLLALAVKLGAP